MWDWPTLVDFARAAGLIDDELDWFRRLQSSLRRLLETGDPHAAAALDKALAEVPVRLAYLADTGHLPLETSGPVERLRLALATAALDAARLDRSRVRRCGSPCCELLFYDTTRNRSRRWCDMAVCGNRAKASAHYHRVSRG